MTLDPESAWIIRFVRSSAVGSSSRARSGIAAGVGVVARRFGEDLLYTARAVLLRGSAAGAIDIASADRLASPTPVEVVIRGRDPIRVVLIGHGGLELGRAEGRQVDGLGGRLADRLHVMTGRGVGLTTVLAPAATRLSRRGWDERLRSGLQEESASHSSPSPELVVYAHAPEEIFRPSRRSGRVRARSLVLHCERLAPAPRAVVLAGVPAPRVSTASGRLAIRQCRAVERDLVRLAASHGPRTSFLPVPSYASAPGSIRLDPEYYAEVARDITQRFLLAGPSGDGDGAS